MDEISEGQTSSVSLCISGPIHRGVGVGVRVHKFVLERGTRGKLSPNRV